MDRRGGGDWDGTRRRKTEQRRRTLHRNRRRFRQLIPIGKTSDRMRKDGQKQFSSDFIPVIRTNNDVDAQFMIVVLVVKSVDECIRRVFQQRCIAESYRIASSRLFERIRTDNSVTRGMERGGGQVGYLCHLGAVVVTPC